MAHSFEVQLLHGLLDAGRRHTLAELRDPTGYDEARFAEAGASATRAERTSALLAALTLRIGGIERPAMDRIHELTVGDRERLNLALCARVLGPEADLTAMCPSCSAVVEMPVRFARVAAAQQASPPAAGSRIAVEADGARWTMRLRPPIGADLERSARGGPGAARDLVVACIEELLDPSGGRASPGDLPSTCEHGVAEALLALDPAAEMRVAAQCPTCASAIDALLDGYALLQGGFAGARRIYSDVYRMARSYHWSEAEILSLPLPRRKLYLAIADEAEARA